MCRRGAGGRGDDDFRTAAFIWTALNTVADGEERVETLKKDRMAREEVGNLRNDGSDVNARERDEKRRVRFGLRGGK